jgi:hypothetical protein
VDIETGVEQGCLLKSMELGTAATRFHVTRLTEASFIVSTPKHARRLANASVDPTRRAQRNPSALRGPERSRQCRSGMQGPPDASRL